MSNEIRLGVGVIVRDDDGRFLLGERIGDSHGAGEWSFPGGKPEPGEAPIDTARRELAEETGLQARNVWPFGYWSYDTWTDLGLVYVTIYTEAALMPGDKPINLEPDKHADWEWLAVDEALKLPLFPGVRGVVLQGLVQ